MVKGEVVAYVLGCDGPEIFKMLETYCPTGYEDDGSVPHKADIPTDDSVAKYKKIMGLSTGDEDDFDDDAEGGSPKAAE